MEIRLRTTRILIFFISNIILLFLLYKIPIYGNSLLENICIFKNVLGVECWNCGMTRAFLSVLHGNIYTALDYNVNVIIVFPLTILIYLYSWYKYIIEN